MEKQIAALDIGDLLYFFILIAGGAYSWYKKTLESKQNTKPQNSNSENSPEQDDPIEDFLKNLSGQISEKPVKKSQLKPELIPNSSFKPSHSFADEILKSKNYEIENVEFDNSKKNTIEDTSIDFYNGYENKNLKLRDLIIAESILNRPYK